MIRDLFVPKTPEEIIFCIENSLNTNSMLLSDFLHGIRSKPVLKDFDDIINRLGYSEGLYIIFGRSALTTPLVYHLSSIENIRLNKNNKYFDTCYISKFAACLYNEKITPWTLNIIIDKNTLLSILKSW